MGVVKIVVGKLVDVGKDLFGNGVWVVLFVGFG